MGIKFLIEKGSLRMKKVGQLIKEWQQALQAEIQHLKKFGSSKFLLLNGRFITNDGSFTYFFVTSQSIRVPVGASIRIQWGGMNVNGRILSSEGKSVIVSLEQNIGDLVSEVYLFHDPWELLEKLNERLDEIKKNKIKRSRIKRLVDPSEKVKHPTENIKSNVHELMLRSQYNAVTFVWGPPGTGKTYTLARVAANKLINNKRILVLAHSNQAVDVLMAEISTFLKKKERFKEGEILRHGSNVNSQLSGITSMELLQTFYPDLADRKQQLGEERRLIKMDLANSFSKRDSDQLLELEMKLGNVLEKIRQKEAEFVKDARIIGATLAKAASDPSIFENEFDLIIVDEVSQAYVPQIAFAVSLAKRSIICGDFKQLPPIAAGRHPLISEWLKEDIFHKSGVTQSVQQGELHPHLLLLKEQRRMHPDISAFTNQYIYHSLVKDHPSVSKSRQEMVERSPFPNRASILLDMSYTGEHCINERTSNSRTNLWQLLISFQLIYESFKAGARSIGYITPYRAQALLMEALLEDVFQGETSEADIIAATVHRFQGSERDVMIFDTVDGYPQERPGMLLFGRESERLINVAITRTKGKFIQVSDTSFISNQISRGKTIRKLVEHQLGNTQAIFPKDIGKWVTTQHPKLKWSHAKKLDQVMNDISKAKSSIILSYPNTSVLGSQWIEILNSRSTGVELTIVSERGMANINVDHQVSSKFPFPFILIDQRVLWLGIPLEGANRIHPPYVAARLDSISIGEYLLKQIFI
jgi:Cdc6-like AAA superfamily ATPase